MTDLADLRSKICYANGRVDSGFNFDCSATNPRIPQMPVAGLDSSPDSLSSDASLPDLPSNWLIPEIRYCSSN